MTIIMNAIIILLVMYAVYSVVWWVGDLWVTGMETLEDDDA
jgi:hypothetical protein